jgi:ribonuclease D
MLDKLKNTELIWVNQPQKLVEITQELSTQDILAVDTESNSLYAYQEQVCLIQFSTRNKDILVDPLALSDLSPLGPIFNSNKIMKVFHAAEYDLICLFRDYGFQFNFLFDTMIAARTLGYHKIGLGSLLEEYFDIHMNKKYQRANWGRRPLKPEMLEYARLDSHFLIPLAEILQRELHETGRWALAKEEFLRLSENIQDTTESNEKDFWKLRGARDLTNRQAAVLKSVYQFREKQAEKQDRPPFKVVSHQALMDIARKPPENLEDLANLYSLNQRLVKQYGRGLLRAVQVGKKAPPEIPPNYERPDEAFLHRIDALKDWRKSVGREISVPSDVILPKDVLNRIARGNPENKSELETFMEDVPYRCQRFGGEILSILNQGEKTA